MQVEQIARLEALKDLLMTENRPQYWEFTDRGVNFAYLEPELRPHLDQIFDWIQDKQSR